MNEEHKGPIGGHIRRIAALLSLLLVASFGPAHATGGKIETDHLIITYEDVSLARAQNLAGQAEEAFGAVTAYLSKKYTQGKITISISHRYNIPLTTRDSRVLIPASLVQEGAGGRGSSIVHQLTLAIARSQGKPNRYLDEGLAVFMQEKFGRDKSYPALGEDIHQATARLIRTVGEPIPIQKLEETRITGRASSLIRLAHVQEGSFVRYLVETYGLQGFMAMYEGKSYEEVYKKDLDSLEAEWKEFVQGIN